MKPLSDSLSRAVASRCAWLALLLAAALSSGCASDPPPRTLLALPATVSALAPVAPAAADGAAGLRLAVRRVDIPEYLQSRRVRYRADASTIGEWRATVWSERIEVAVTREFVGALRAALPGQVVCEATCPEPGAALALTVELQPLDYLRSLQRLQARARVTLAGTGPDGQVLRTLERSFDLPAAADTPQAQAEAISELLRQLAQAVAPLLPARAP